MLPRLIFELKPVMAPASAGSTTPFTVSVVWPGFVTGLVPMLGTTVGWMLQWTEPPR